MNTSYWTNNISRSSDRANLLSGGSSDSSPSSSGRKGNHDHDVNTANMFEQQNDLRLQDLSSKLSTLHRVTLDIHNDVNDQVNNVLDDSGNSFTSFKGGLNGTVGKLKHMTSIRHRQQMFYLILIILGIFFLLYNFWGFWIREGNENNEIEMDTDFNGNNLRNDV